MPDEAGPTGRARRARRTRVVLLAAAGVLAALVGGGTAAWLAGPDRTPPTRAAAPLPTAAPTSAAPVAPPAPEPPPSPPVAPSPSAAGDAAVVEVSGDAVWFRSPSGNIGCGMTATAATCDLREHDWDLPPRPADCELDFGQGVFLDGEATGLTCAGDTSFVPDAPVLAYGSGWQLGSVRCTSAEDGVTCTDEVTGRGFSVNRDRYLLR